MKYIILYIVLLSGCQIKTVHPTKEEIRIKELETYVRELEVENRTWQDACMGKVPPVTK
jgi:hypothetical protein